LSRRIGAHQSIAGGHVRAVESAARAGMTALQVFTKSSNQWAAKPLTETEIRAFRDALAAAGIEGPVGHNSYLINLASPDAALWSKSVDAMTVEAERAEALGLTDLVAHPGAHIGSGEEAGLARVAEALDVVHRRTSGVAVRIALEITAGQGTCLGHRFEHLGQIRERVAEPERLGVCLDTCHLFAAGYALDDARSYNRTIAACERHVGLRHVRVWHLNDSLKPLGSRVDRHAGIGRGLMGLGPFRRVLNDPRFAALPMILETPKGTEHGEDLDVINLRVLRSLIEDAPRRRGLRRETA
jgi:deoxyribonuclease-4